jgi:toxin-antitoxin system PIN domain toxin
MISFCPDVNVWLALADAQHRHHAQALAWLNQVPSDGVLILSWYAQLAMLRLLTNPAVMGLGTLTIGQAWAVFDRFFADPRVEFPSEPHGLDAAFRKATTLLESRAASKWVGDCFLLAYADAARATFVTFDQPLLAFSRKHGYNAVSPS